ncbi:MAG: twin-arginine translocase TatA/TatE family subunit [Gammaproteobacteria bacterium]|jgi:sec-independent protein translocase protein TatB|nr:twin-arginine translocase TatA/TatE family subunit [Gammaproteobacteria bacterium]
MFDVGFWELAILFGLGLVVLGPEKLPRVASQIGNWAGQARRMARNLSAQMQAEVNLDMNDPFKTTAPKKPQTKTPQEVKPAWQTSEGLRPGYSQDQDSEIEEDGDAVNTGHTEYDPTNDPEHESFKQSDGSKEA